MKKQMKLFLVVILALSMMMTTFTACGSGYEARNGKLDTSKDITLTVAGAWTEFKALDLIGQEFTKIFPNVTIEYESLQNYADTAPKRLATEGDSIDLFLTDNIQEGSPFLDYALDLNSESAKFSLESTFEGMIKNFTLSGGDEIYAVPLGSEVRGMFVNMTLLDKYGIDVPRNREQLLAACETLKAEGFVPLQGNPGMFAQLIAYPAVANCIANAEDYETAYNLVNTCDEGAAEVIREPMEFLYTIMENKYYNYKFVETEYNSFVLTDDESISKDFLGIKDDGSGNIVADPVGTIAFMPGPASLQTTMLKTKDDYHSDVEYKFILSPITDDGGVAYLSPGKGIAINKNSDQLDWSLEFMNFLFTEKYNKQFNEEFHLLPNTSDAVEYAVKMFDVSDTQICELGEVTFDYGFYGMVTAPMVDIVKGNNPKYMKNEKTLYEFEYYMDLIKSAFATQKALIEE